MADTKITGLTELSATPDGADVLAIIDDPAGTPVSKKITVTNLMAAGGGKTFAKVVKSSDETRQSDTTLTDDSQLLFTPTINKTYSGYITLFYESGATPDFKLACTIPSGATAHRLEGLWAANADNQVSDFETSYFIAMTSGTRSTQLPFKLIMSSTAGDFNFQWAQNTSDASDTKVLAGSLLVVWEE